MEIIIMAEHPIIIIISYAYLMYMILACAQASVTPTG